MQPPAKKRRIGKAAVEEISFDPAARQEYLTGFHKRKLQRTKQAQEAAEKKARLERIEERRKLREERKADLERHVEQINTLLQPHDAGSTDESQSETESTEMDSWNGVSKPSQINHEADYIDEDRYTTVTVEAMDVSKEGLHKVDDDERDKEVGNGHGQAEGGAAMKEGENVGQKRKWTRERPKDKADRQTKKKKKKFRYESKGERKVARAKQKMRNSKQASARRAG